MAEKTVQFSIDLVEAALKQRQFLQLVDAYPSLYAGQHVHNAIRRCVYFTANEANTCRQMILISSPILHIF